MTLPTVLVGCQIQGRKFSMLTSTSGVVTEAFGGALTTLTEDMTVSSHVDAQLEEVRISATGSLSP